MKTNARGSGRKERGRPALLAALLVLLFPLTATATTVLELSADELVLKADMIFVGEVSATSSARLGGVDWTDVTFDVEEWLLTSSEGDSASEPVEGEGEAGSESGEEVTLRFLGGERLSVAGVPTYEPGDRVLLFVYDADGLASPVVGFGQGSFLITPGNVANSEGASLRVTEDGGLAVSTVSSSLGELKSAIAELLASGVLESEPLEQENAEPIETDQGESDTTVEEGSEPDGAPALTARAVQYEIAADTAGTEPSLLLREAVTQAAEAWQVAALGAVVFEEVVASGVPGEGAHRLRYGEEELFGDDTLSLTLFEPGAGSGEVVISPRAGEFEARALLHELGLLAGLSAGKAGVMRRVVPVTEPLASPTAADVRALTALQTHAPEDINRDGKVDFHDLLLLASSYGRTGFNLPADINGDGVVDDSDLVLLEAAYSFSPPARTLPKGE